MTPLTVIGAGPARDNRAAGGRELTSVALAHCRVPTGPRGHGGPDRSEDAPDQEDDPIRLPDTPTVRVRELGPRTLEEVPLGEVAELARLTSWADGCLDRALARAGAARG